MYKRLWQLLSNNEKKKSWFFLLLTFFNTIIELSIVLMVIPLTQILLNQTVELPYFGKIDFLNNYAYSKLAFFAIVGLLSIFLIKNVFITYYLYWQIKFINSIELRLSNKLLEKYIYRPYTYHLNSNTGFLNNNVLNEVQHIPGNIKGILTLISETVILVLISSVLILYEPKGTSIIIGVAILLLLLINGFQKKYMVLFGSESYRYTGQSNKHLLEGLSNIKDIKILGKEKFFINNYFKNFKNAIKFRSLYQFFGQIPRPTYELIMVLSFGFLIIFLLGKNDPNIIILTTSLFLIATYRLLPSIVRITASFQAIQTRKDVILSLSKDLLDHDKEIDEIKLLKKSDIKFKLNDEINFEKISFIYPQTKKLILDDVNLKIKKGEMIGIVGPSGSGKTTIIDILLGLLKPTIGKLIVDGVQINEKNVKSFQDIVGYVPQSPTFIDDTIKKNIAFGVEDKEIDNKLIESSINQANLKEFLNTQKNGVNTIIGEKGVRISGGQKQRISIARALYKNPEILIFDEATSSLDEKNESEIINNISLVKDNKTIVVIAHKLSILENCDKILKLKEGKIYE